MAKRIPITDELKTAIKKSVGGDVKFDNLAVYEAIAVTSRPIVQRGLYSGATVERDLMEAAADKINTGEFVPLHLVHDQPWGGLPVGRLFQAGVSKDPMDQADQLHTLFYLDEGTEEGKTLASKVDNGVIEEVSIGMMAEKLLCSECNFDYLSDEDALWDRCCPEGHMLGKGNFHLKLSGLKKLMELSLVSKGASTGAKVLAERKRLLASQFEVLAADGYNPERVALFASPTLGEEVDMKEIEELKAGLAALTAKVEEQAVALTTAQATITAQAEELTSLKASAEVTAKFGDKVDAIVSLADKAEEINGLSGRIEELKASQVAAPTPAAHPFKIPLDGVDNLRAAAQGLAEQPTKRGSAFKTKR
jgi:hypothetical protein